MRLIQWAPQTASRTNGWNEIDREFDRLMNWAFGSSLTSETATSVPPMDFVEESDHYRVSMDLPGFSKDGLDVTIDDGVLTIRGERKSENEETKDGKVVRRERFRGTVERSMRLGKKVDSTKVEASYRNGVLELVIPFAPEAQPVRLQLKD